MVTAIQPVAERVKLTPPMVRFESVKFIARGRNRSA